MARAELDGRPLCSALLLVISGPPGLLGQAPVELTAWFYGHIEPKLELMLEDMADARRGYVDARDDYVLDLVIQADGGELRLEGCRLGVPVRPAGPATTLEFQLFHPGAERPALRLVA